MRSVAILSMGQALKKRGTTRVLTPPSVEITATLRLRGGLQAVYPVEQQIAVDLTVFRPSSVIRLCAIENRLQEIFDLLSWK